MRKWNDIYHAIFKKHTLGNQIWDKKNLEKAWKQVRANKGSAGIDGVTIEEFEQNLEHNLSEIQRQLKENHYSKRLSCHKAMDIDLIQMHMQRSEKPKHSSIQVTTG